MNKTTKIVIAIVAAALLIPLVFGIIAIGGLLAGGQKIENTFGKPVSEIR